jgi:hypothetical protein
MTVFHHRPIERTDFTPLVGPVGRPPSLADDRRTLRMMALVAEGPDPVRIGPFARDARALPATDAEGTRGREVLPALM